MSLDSDLVEKIKKNFARKSSAQLREIAGSNDRYMWSLEAVAAAAAILQSRIAGQAREPEFAEEEPSPPTLHYEADEVAGIGGLLGLLTGISIVPYFRVTTAEELDIPVPFGLGAAWVTLDTADTRAVAIALDLREPRDATWANGVHAAYRSSVFVTPPLAGWTVAVSIRLFPPDRAHTFVKPLLERLSQQFGDAQYFCTHQGAGLYIWARALQGELIRGYGWLGTKSRTIWDEGAPTKAERDLGYLFSEGRSSSGASPDENCVAQIACVWSVDPTSLNEQYKEPLTGILGEAPPSGPSSP